MIRDRATDGIGPWDKQYNWLKQTLENSNAKYKFIFAHHTDGGTNDYVRGEPPLDILRVGRK